MVMAWGYDIVMVSEVRASASALRTLARRARACGYFSSWSHPPPQAATFSVAPGGVAILAKDPLALRTEKIPELQMWVEQGRLVVCKLVSGSFVCHLACLYAFPVTHPRRGENESFFRMIYSWAMSLRSPVLIGGDWNETRQSSQFLSLCGALGLVCISPNTPTTRAKRSPIAKSAAIDHVVVNQHFLDLRVSSVIRYDMCVSDHYPIEVKWCVQQHEHMAWDWPKPMKITMQKSHPPWKATCTTYQEWAHEAVTWIANACQCEPVHKTVVGQHVQGKKRIGCDQKLAIFLRIQQLLNSMREGGERSVTLAWKKLERKFSELEMACPHTLEECHDVTQQALQRYMQYAQEQAIKKWKEKVSSWNPTASSLFRYLRNLEPAKASVIVCESGELTNDPIRMWAELEMYWANIESLPIGYSEETLLEVLWDRYSAFLPSVQCVTQVDGNAVMSQAKSQRKSAPGPDGWVHKELALLPLEAWTHLLKLWRGAGVEGSSLFWFRRVPLEKKSDVEPRASAYRPIDVYSQILRAVTSAHVRAMRGWAREVLMPTQYASQGGVCMAVDALNVYAEAVLHGAATLWGVSVDFAKLFNSICPRVAVEAAKILGVGDDDAKELMLPFDNGCGFWRLPNNTTAPPANHPRGLPQGLASSVLLSEVFLSIFLRRLHRCVDIDSVCYVDDITLVATSKDQLLKALDLLTQFASDFCLVISQEKTRIWGSNRAQLRDLARDTGFAYTETLEALGAEWALHEGAEPQYRKEHARVEECKARLDRLAHLPSHLNVKAQAIAMGCISLLAHSVSPIRKVLNGAPLKVKKSLGQPYAAPEVLYNILSVSTLDLVTAWALTLLRMLCFLRRCDLGRKILARLKMGRKHSRTAALLRYFTTMGWRFDGNLVITEVGEVDLRKKWSWVREDFVKVARRDAFGRLAKRRPRVYDGISVVDVTQHKKLLGEVSSYQASLLLRVWSGVAMTRAHKHTLMTQESPTCACELEEQTIDHLLFRCPLSGSVMPEEEAWASRPPAQTVALLCPREMDPDVKKVWRNLCFKVIKVLSSPLVSAPPDFDWKGHMVTTTPCERFAYCGLCHVIRKARDSKFIASKECPRRGEHPTWVGEYRWTAGHMVRCKLAKWKFAGLRPKWVCVCGVSWWPESSPLARACIL